MTWLLENEGDSLNGSTSKTRYITRESFESKTEEEKQTYLFVDDLNMPEFDDESSDEEGLTKFLHFGQHKPWESKSTKIIGRKTKKRAVATQRCSICQKVGHNKRSCPGINKNLDFFY